MIPEHQLSQLATKAGFGANGINTHRVKLILMRGKPRHSWRGRIAPTAQQSQCSTVLTCYI